MSWFQGGAFDDATTSFKAKVAVIAAGCVLPLVLLLCILIGVADETELVWNSGGSEQKWFRASVLFATLFTFPIFGCVVVSICLFLRTSETL